MLFYLPFGLRPDGNPSANRQQLAHRAGFCEVTRVELVSPHAASRTPDMAAVVDTGLAQLRTGPEYRFELGFDGESQGRQADFRPLLPLVFHW
jgi:hypothetical protein